MKLKMGRFKLSMNAFLLIMRILMLRGIRLKFVELYVFVEWDLLKAGIPDRKFNTIKHTQNLPLTQTLTLILTPTLILTLTPTLILTPV